MVLLKKFKIRHQACLKRDEEKSMASIKVQGMKCQHCADSTRKALEEIPGISNVRVQLDSGEVRFDGAADMETIKAAIAAAGYQLVE